MLASTDDRVTTADYCKIVQHARQLLSEAAETPEDAAEHFLGQALASAGLMGSAWS